MTPPTPHTRPDCGKTVEIKDLLIEEYLNERGTQHFEETK